MPRKTPAEPVPNRLPEALRRRMRIGALSLLATTGLLGTYVGYPGLRRAYAVDCAPVRNEAQLIAALNNLGTGVGECDTITISATTITLTGSLPDVTNRGTFTIRGAGPDQTYIVGAGAYSGFSFSGAVSDVTISDLTITNTVKLDSGSALYVNGDVTASGTNFTNNSSYNGGAIFAHGMVGLSNSTFADNSATASDGYGGAVYSLQYVQVSESTFTGNVASKGGAIYSTGSILISDSSNFSNNTATSGGGGGALFTPALVEVSDSTLSYNYADAGSGGAVYSMGTVTISGSTLTGNDANQWGGAIYALGARVFVYSSSFSDNTAIYGGGAIYGQSVDVTDSSFTRNATSASNGGAIFSALDMEISGSTFSGNAANYYGGALFNPSALPTSITTSTFYANSADFGSAIASYGELDVDFSTIVENTSTTFGGYAVQTFSSDLTVSNSIIYGNRDSGGDAHDLNADGDLTVSYSLVTSVSSVGQVTGSPTLISVIYGDPLLGRLTNNGGPTVGSSTQKLLTIMPAADSPVIGRADPTSAPEYDQRGYTRTTNGLADMGSVERGGTPPKPDLSQLPPSWFQATTRTEQSDSCPPGMHASWAEWPNEHTGGWTCEWTTWWDVDNGMHGGWVTTPGFNPGRPFDE